MSYTSEEVLEAVKRVAYPYLKEELLKTVDEDGKWNASHILHMDTPHRHTISIPLTIGFLNIEITKPHKWGTPLGDYIQTVAIEYEILTPNYFSIIPRNTFTRTLNLVTSKGTLDSLLLKHCKNFIRTFNTLHTVSVPDGTDWCIPDTYKKMYTSIYALKAMVQKASVDCDAEFVGVDGLMMELRSVFDSIRKKHNATNGTKIMSNL